MHWILCWTSFITVGDHSVTLLVSISDRKTYWNLEFVDSIEPLNCECMMVMAFWGGRDSFVEMGHCIKAWGGWGVVGERKPL